MKWTEFPISSVGYSYKLKGCSVSQVQAEGYYTDIITLI